MLYDRDIREPLFEFLEEQYGKIRIIEEKRMGRSRADIVMVLPESVVGIEIKSDADSYARLKRQVKDYNQYFDYNYAVVGSRHGAHIEEHVPDWWGIITVEEAETENAETENVKKVFADFYILRHPKENPGVNWQKKLGLLWRSELAHIQELNSMAKYKEKSKAFVVEKILEKVPKERLKAQISQELFERDYTEIEDVIREYRRGRR